MDTLFFIFSKVAWSLVSPDFLLSLSICVCLLLFWFDRKSIAKKITVLVLPALIILTCFPVGQWILHPLETRFPHQPNLPENIDGIIVLSGAELLSSSYEWGQLELNEAAERIVNFMTLIRKYPEARPVFAGGSGKVLGQGLSSASLVEIFLAQNGIETSRILFEKKSRNTYENGKFNYSLVNPSADENWVLITTAWHMPRSVGIFRQLGWNVIPYPVDHRGKLKIEFKPSLHFAENLALFKVSVKEWIGLVAYYLSGKTSELFPG